MSEQCPNCFEVMSSGDSGEPYNTPGWWCSNCGEFFSDDDLAEDYDPCEEYGHDWHTVTMAGEEVDQCNRCGMIDA